MVDDQTNQLIVFTTPAGHDRIAKFLDYFDQPAIQVLIKTRVLELSAENEKQLGFNLDHLIYHGNGFTTTGGNSTGVDTSFSTDTSISTGVSTGVSTSTSTGTGRNNATITGGATSFLPGNLGPGTLFQFVGLRTDPKFQITVSALMNSRFTKVLSEPQVLAINNKEATISVKTGFHYITDLRPLQQNIVTGIGTQVPNTSSFIPTFGDDSVGFTLTVTPSVGRDLKTINLHINPYIDALAEGQQIQNFQTFQVGSGQGSVQPAIQQPTKDQTELETDVVIEDNGYVILGGLMRTRREVRKREIPGFSKIPVLGNMFKSTSTDVTKDNLVIIVEAQIITPTGRTYYKCPEPDDVNPREGGVIRAPLQTSEARHTEEAREALLAAQRENPPPPADPVGKDWDKVKPEKDEPEPRKAKASSYSKSAPVVRNDTNDAPYAEQTQARQTARERMERAARAARASVAARPKPSEWSVSPEETLDGQPAAAQPAADNPNAKGEVLGLDK
jgi:Flp pilus assembly secretin CpaC